MVALRSGTRRWEEEEGCVGSRQSVRVRVRACVRACVRARVRACMYVFGGGHCRRRHRSRFAAGLLFSRALPPTTHAHARPTERRWPYLRLHTVCVAPLFGEVGILAVDNDGSRPFGASFQVGFPHVVEGPAPHCMQTPARHGVSCQPG